MNEELCDEEKSYYEWVSKNLDYISKHKESVGVMKKLYMEGFAAGFHHKHIILAQEQLQK
jgi:hypothetical protein